MIRLLIADDHTVLRQALAQVLNAEPDFEIVAEAADGQQAVELTRQYKPDVAILDINMPYLNGVDATRQIMQMANPPHIIILTMSEDDEQMLEAIRAGAKGYFLKNSDISQLVTAIRAVIGGDVILDTKLAHKVINLFRGRQRHAHVAREDITEQTVDDIVLDEREVLLLRAVAQGWSNQEIANYLGRSEKTIKNQLSNLFRKLNLNNRTQAALYALKKGLITLEEVDLPNE
nr:response regulator transcription factor [Ardenticatena sp.]